MRLILMACCLFLFTNGFAVDKEPTKESKDSHFLNAIMYLQEATNLADSIQDVDSKSAVSEAINSYADDLKLYYASNNLKMVCEETTAMFENLDEILAEVPSSLRMRIYYLITTALKEVQSLGCGHL